MKYNVEIIETLARIVRVEADSEYEAIEKAKDHYRDEEIILTGDDFVETEYKVVDDAANPDDDFTN